uniref:Breast cancer anti-estrogen resistance protein 1 n=1 Tax=Glossina pallidipes TaxID=7398 RepID=A0A1B0AET4_GLOPL
MPVITPQRHGDVYVYHTPAPIISYPTANTTAITTANLLESYPSHQQIYQNLPTTKFISHEFENYDIPKPAIPVNYDLPKNLNRTIMAHLPTSTPTSATSAAINTMIKTCATVIQEENYDIPRPLAGSILQHQHTLTPSSSNSSLLTSDSLSLSFSSSNRSSLANMPDYDVPRRNPLPVRTVLQQQQQQQQQQQHQQHQQHQQMQHQSQQRPSSRTSLNGNCLSYDFPLPVSNTSLEKTGAQALLITKELPLELLLSFVSTDWRTHDKLEPVLMEVKLAVVRLRTALHDLTEFGEGALGNAARSEDRTLAQKLRPIIRALRDANKLVQDSCETLETRGGWCLENLTRNEDKNVCKPPDSLDQLVACAQTLTEDVRSTTSFIQGNASLLFKRHLPELIEEVPTQNANENDEQRNATEWLEDYDYVSFESKDAAAKKNSVLREAIPENLKNKFDNALKAAENTVITVSNTLPTTPNGKKPCSELTDKDKMLVRYYAVQISTHMGNLRQAIDSFLETVEKNQPPKFFIAYGKFVVVSAHNLVTIGDIVHRNVSKSDLKEKILRCTDALSEALKTCVLKSKQAAAHFPSVTAVQEMVDSVVDISHLASDLKTVMLHAVQLTI